MQTKTTTKKISSQSSKQNFSSSAFRIFVHYPITITVLLCLWHSTAAHHIAILLEVPCRLADIIVQTPLLTERGHGNQAVHSMQEQSFRFLFLLVIPAPCHLVRALVCSDIPDCLPHLLHKHANPQSRSLLQYRK